MELTNKRIAHTAGSTLGILHVDGKPFAFVIEDEPRQIKVKGETRIPQGRYKLRIQPEATPLTLKYREKYNWFKNHIELTNVPNFTGVYIHIGNYESDTEGCQIIGRDATITDTGNYANMRSTLAFMDFYQTIYYMLEAGKQIFYNVLDADL